MAFFKPQRESLADSLSKSLTDIFSYYNIKEEGELKKTSNSISYLANLFGSTDVDTISDINVIRNIVKDEKENSPIEHQGIYDVFEGDLEYKEKLMNEAATLSGDVDVFNENWFNLEYDDVSNLTLEKVIALQTDFDKHYNTYSNITSQFGVDTRHINTATHRKMKKMSDSFDEAIADLLITERLTPEDWKIITSAPHMLGEIRKERIADNRSIYERYSKLYDNSLLMNTTDMAAQLKTGETVSNLLARYVRNPYTGGVDYTKIGIISKRIEKLGVMALPDEIKKIQEDLGRILKTSNQNLIFWSGKSYDEQETGVPFHDERIEKEKIWGSLLSGDSISINEKYIEKTDTEGVDLFISPMQDSARVKKLPNGKYELESWSGTTNMGTLENPTKFSGLEAKNLADLGWYLWNNADEKSGRTVLSKEAQNVFIDRGLASAGTYGVKGHQFDRATMFIREMKKLDKLLRDKNATSIAYLNKEGERIVLNIKDVWAGPKGQEDINALTNLLQSDKIWINEEPLTDMPWKMYKKSLNDLDARLSNIKKK